MATSADFTPFNTTNGRRGAYSAYDPAFVQDMRRLGAKFGKTAAGRGMWHVDGSAQAIKMFDACCDQARARNAVTGPTMTRAQLAARHDAIHNDGGEGYNPYRGA